MIIVIMFHDRIEELKALGAEHETDQFGLILTKPQNRLSQK